MMMWLIALIMMVWGGYFPCCCFVKVDQSLLNALWLIANHVGGPSGFN
jgi:hypothetical protein